MARVQVLAYRRERGEVLEKSRLMSVTPADTRGGDRTHRSMYVTASSAVNHPILVNRRALHTSRTDGCACDSWTVSVGTVEARPGVAKSPPTLDLWEPGVWYCGLCASRCSAARKRRFNASLPLETTVLMTVSARPSSPCETCAGADPLTGTGNPAGVSPASPMYATEPMVGPSFSIVSILVVSRQTLEEGVIACAILTILLG